MLSSFIHYGDLYSASSRLLLRSAPNPCMAKKNNFQARVECFGKNPGEQSLCQRKPIPHRGVNHRECTRLSCGSTGKRNKESMYVKFFLHSNRFHYELSSLSLSLFRALLMGSRL